jgi:hypothetical protein
MPKVGVVISMLNFNDLTEKCVDSVLDNINLGDKIIVIDDGSKVPYIDSRIKVIRFDNPHGNTSSMNIGIMYCLDNLCDYIYNLDNDTELEPNAIKELVDVMEMQPNLAVAGSIRRQILNGKEQYVGRSLDMIKGCAESTKPNTNPFLCYWISGCSIMMRANVIREIGMFDKRFKNYCQDCEWCLRAFANGYTNAVVPKSIVKHIGEITMHSTLSNHLPDKEEFIRIISGKYLNDILKYLPLDASTNEYGRLTFDTFNQSPTAK